MDGKADADACVSCAGCESQLIEMVGNADTAAAVTEDEDEDEAARSKGETETEVVASVPLVAEGDAVVSSADATKCRQHMQMS
jgi:hypothetical protein